VWTDERVAEWRRTGVRVARSAPTSRSGDGVTQETVTLDRGGGYRQG
jgi:hypothetical protein